MGRLTTGAPGAVVFRTLDAVLGELELRVLDVDDDRDLDLVHEWVRRPWAAFWGLGGHSRDELREVYRFVDSLPSHHAFLLRRDGEPIVLLQTYEPEHDPVGEHYDVRTGDVGVHFFLGGRGAPAPGFTTRVLLVLADFVFADPGALRVVVEPDIGNERAIARMTRFGFTPGPEIALEHKTARLAFLERAAFEERAARPPVVG
ncbi:GNAT family N-acetyltransferase [Agromyces sp. CFH 90414]|uniref:Lysine N-acyltransferase MbtK n=1 Tax=Agromyces agglutinans TaxID=2662258 RepID=A0A6I2FAM9_9MICO|nr:GNAT family N-acetyltransferase [Agromyces agglutinans]MRG59013.1 GNAT family N-acetyltransferase [Agromyces agglutinans]